MDHVTIEEHGVVERYLLGQLAPEEAEGFEEHYLDCPECLEKLELSRRLRDGLKEVAAEEGSELARTAIVAWLLRRGRALQAGLTVALLAVVILPWAFLAPEVSRLSHELDQALAPQVRTPVYSLSPERSGAGEEPSTRITLGPAPEWVVLALRLPPSQSPATCRVHLRQTEGESLWRSGIIEPDISGRVTFSVHSSWLEAAGYVVELDAPTSEGEYRRLTRFAFQIQREE